MPDRNGTERVDAGGEGAPEDTWPLPYDNRESCLARNWSCVVRDPLWATRIAFNIGLCLPVSALGIVGNLLALVVLCRLKPRTTTKVLLQCLAVADIFVLVFSIIFISVRTLVECYLPCSVYWRHLPYMFPYLYPFVYITRTCSTWLTVLLTVNRYIVVCKPLHAWRICTLSKLWKEVVLLVLLSVLFSLPRFFEHTTTLRRTKMVTDRRYILVYRICLFTLVNYIIPIVLLSILNILLVRNLRQADVTRDRLRAASKESVLKRSITLVVAVVVLIHLLCNVPAMAAHVTWSVEITFRHRQGALVNARRYMSIVSNFLIVFNSAVNFVIYVLCIQHLRTSMRSIGFRPDRN